jgi:adenosylcobyric acid synthase
MHNISIFGTNSDAGKSTITLVIAKILQDMGYSVAPFKAQNVSNNAKVCDDLSEIAIAQYFQATALKVPTSYHLNPVLLKSGRGNSASLIVEGKVVTDKDVREYYRDLDILKPAVDRCFEYLDSRYDCVVCEGAGSPVELNLMDKDLSNIYIATKYNTKIILVADIQKGGVFASIYGVYNLLPKQLQDNVIGVIINKFQGDMTLFDDGVKIIEQEFGIHVLGVLPYEPLNLGFEDSASLKNFVQNTSKATKNIAVIAYPTMSNYNDFEPLINDDTINLQFIESNINLEIFDLVILPGSKLVYKDLDWLKDTGLFSQLQNRSKDILGICGGYEMMFENLHDFEQIENQTPTSVKGLEFIDDDIYFQKEKVLKKNSNRFEIHHGISKKYPLEYEKDHIKGTFEHGIFDDETFEKFKKEKINSFVNSMKSRINLDKLISFNQIS